MNVSSMHIAIDVSKKERLSRLGVHCKRIRILQEAPLRAGETGVGTRVREQGTEREARIARDHRVSRHGEEHMCEGRHGGRRFKESRRREGHEGASRSGHQHIDSTLELDLSTCLRCGGVLSSKPTDSYTKVVEDIVPARVALTKYVVSMRYYCMCTGQVSTPMQNVIGGASNKRFGLRLMLLVVSLYLLRMSC
jgi:hypothetical protein